MIGVKSNNNHFQLTTVVSEHEKLLTVILQAYINQTFENHFDSSIG